MSAIAEGGRFATRSGPLHSFADDPAAAEAFSAHPWDAPIDVELHRGGESIGLGKLKAASVDGDDLVGEIDWPDEIESEVGDGTPSVHCEFSPDGRLTRVYVDLDDAHDEPGGCGPDCECEGEGCDELLSEEDETMPTEKAATTDYTAELGKHKGDAGAMAMAQFNEANRLRAELETASADLAEARKAIPAEGTRVLSAADARRFDAWQALGSPEEVGKAIEDGRAASGKVAAFEREKVVHEAAALHGFKPEVVARLAGADLPIEIDPKGKDKDGKEAKVAVVVRRGKDKDGKDTEERVRLDEFAAKEWASFAPALEAKPSPQTFAPLTPNFAPAGSFVPPPHQPTGQPEPIRSVF